jgi:hypothetical protein
VATVQALLVVADFFWAEGSDPLGAIFLDTGGLDLLWIIQPVSFNVLLPIMQYHFALFWRQFQ